MKTNKLKKFKQTEIGKSKTKVLIIFDTNSIGHYEMRFSFRYYPDYSNVVLNSGFYEILNFIKRNSLKKNVYIAIPRIVILELSNQQNNSHNNIKSILNSINNLPNINIKIDDINYNEYIIKKFGELITKTSIKIIEIPKKGVINSLINRVFSKKSAPFIKSNSQKDRGFKDALIWESIISYFEIKKFDTIFFLCKDNGFNNQCKEEFLNKFSGKNFELMNNQQNCKQTISNLANIFKIDIDLDYVKKIIDTNLNDYILDDLKYKQFVIFNNKKTKIKAYKIKKIALEEPEFISSEDGYLVKTEIELEILKNKKLKVIAESTMFPNSGINQLSYDYDLMKK